MSSVKIAELKAHLSEYLRRAQGGERVVVFDRDRPVAELRAISPEPADGWQRLADGGTLRLGPQDWEDLVISPVKRAVPVRRLLDEVRGEE